MKYINWYAVGIGCFAVGLMAFFCSDICSADKVVGCYIVGILNDIAGVVCGYIGKRLNQ